MTYNSAGVQLQVLIVSTEQHDAASSWLFLQSFDRAQSAASPPRSYVAPGPGPHPGAQLYDASVAQSVSGSPGVRSLVDGECAM